MGKLLGYIVKYWIQYDLQIVHIPLSIHIKIFSEVQSLWSSLCIYDKSCLQQKKLEAN